MSMALDLGIILVPAIFPIVSLIFSRSISLFLLMFLYHLFRYREVASGGRFSSYPAKWRGVRCKFRPGFPHTEIRTVFI